MRSHPSDPTGPELREQDAAVTLRVRVQPRAAKDGVSGVREGALCVRLTAPPVEGEANAALLRFLGKAVGVPPSACELLRGQHGRDKLVRVSGVTAAAVRERLRDWLPAGGR
ncbi:MAG TPA: DUF167 domain-containing protein [Vicinamibacteria bacterium]|nr:DUF167 domain-containing protein [Vicinamibacteria bacterium]